ICIQIQNEDLAQCETIHDCFSQCLPKSNLIISADTNETGCCVDFLTASHCFSDAIIHYGESCLSTCSRMPSYIFSNYLEPTLILENQLLEYIKTESNLNNEKFTIIWDVKYSHIADSALLKNFCMLLPDIYFNVFQLDSKLNLQVHRVSAQTENYHLTVASLNHHLETKAKILGIFVTPFVYDQYPTIPARVRQLLTENKFQFYEISVNIMSQEKIDAYPEIDTFIYLACPFTMAKCEPKKFFKPLIYLFCLEYTFNSNFNAHLSSFTYDMGFFEPGQILYTNIKPLDSRQPIEPSSEIQIKSFYDNLPINFLEWKGLELKYGDTESSQIIKGRDGIASIYSHEEVNYNHFDQK
ncbi:MAG: Diphthamide biosynthesis protein 2, partial [Paramarteilia canceri]